MKALIISLAVLCLASAAAGLEPSDGPSLGNFHISHLDGDVQIKTEDTKEWVPASLNMPLRAGDRIWAPEGSRAELHSRDGALVRLNESTSLDVLTAEERSAQFFLNSGKVYVVFRGRTDSFLQMDTPVSSSRVYERAKFRMDVTEKDFVDIYVYDGRVSVDHDGDRSAVNAGKRLSLTGRSLADLRDLGMADEWEQWNRERDRSLEDRAPDARYLPEELSSYSSDLDRHGRWAYLPDHGYCWTPTYGVAPDWAPYQHGRWLWVRGDYVWLSHEPWGWAPYHYGRWVFVVSRGWFWVPPRRGAVYWGPGFVGWVHTPTYVAWVPLAPGELYYGYGHYGPHSVNLLTININTVVVKQVYKNARGHHAVTVIRRDSFGSGRHERIRVGENPFMRERISAGRPDIKPRRESVIPVIKDIPAAKHPPARIRDIKVEEVQRRRPMVRAHEAQRSQGSGHGTRSEAARPAERRPEQRPEQRIDQRPADGIRDQRRDQESEQQREPSPRRERVQEPEQRSAPPRERERQREEPREQRQQQLSPQGRDDSSPQGRESSAREGSDTPDRREGQDGRGRGFSRQRDRLEGGAPFTPSREGASGR